MHYESEVRRLKAERDRLVKAERREVESIRPGDTRTAAQVARLEDYAEGIASIENRLQAMHEIEQRERDGAELQRITAGRPVSPTASSLGADLQNAIGEVLDGKAASHVDLPSITNALYESGSAGDGVPIELKSPVTTLNAASVVMGLPGLRKETMNSDRAVYPRIGVATADGTAEGATLTAADTQTDSVTVVAQKFSSYEELSSELVEDFSAGALAAFGENLIRHLALRVDLGLLEGDGANDIVGIRNTPGVNSTSVAGTPSDFSKFRTGEYELRLDNGEPVVWVTHPRVWNTLAGIKTGISSDETTLLEPDPQRGPRTLLSYPVRFSTQLTLTEGAGAGSWAALLDTSQLVVCERRPARLEVSRDFKFDQDVIAVRATWRGGLAVLNPEAISLLTDIRA